MIIEFADPGYNWAFVWWVGATFVVSVTLLFLPFLLTLDERKIGLWPMVGVLMLAVPAGIAMASVGNYHDRTRAEVVTGLQEHGLSNVQVSGDRFTASTEDGQYFRGILVDLRPDSGYAYRVLEITDTKGN